MRIIQLLIDEAYQDKATQQIIAEASDILKELNKGKEKDANKSELEQENSLNNKGNGTERR